MSQPEPWFRMYHSTLDNPKVQRLSGDQFKAWMNLLFLACRHGGRLPDNESIAFALRVSETKIAPLLERFVDIGLIDRDGDELVMHDWDTLQFKSDVSTTRVRRFRERKRNVSSSVSETHQSRADQNRPEQKVVSKTEPCGKPVHQTSVGDSKNIIGSLLPKLKNQSTWTKEQRKAAWQSKICNLAQAQMTDAKYAQFLEAWANGEKWANETAEQIDSAAKAARARA